MNMAKISLHDTIGTMDAVTMWSNTLMKVNNAKFEYTKGTPYLTLLCGGVIECLLRVFFEKIDHVRSL